MNRPRRSFSLNRRPTTRKNRYIYYVRFRDSEGNYLSAISSGKTNRVEAEQWAWEFLARGITPGKREQSFGRFAEGFWDYEKSLYIQRRLARGFTFSRRYADICRGNTENHLIPAFGHRKLSELSRKEIDHWILTLYKEGTLSPTTVNKLLTLFRVMLEEAKKAGYIGENPAAQVEPVKTAATEKAVLSGKEVQRLFAPGALKAVWDGKRSYFVMNLLAASTGMRQGELRGLQRRYIHAQYLEVRHAWEDRYGLKEPKNHSERIVPIPNRVSEEISFLIDSRQLTAPESLLFSGRDSSHPLDKKMVQRTFNRALQRIGISETERRARNVSFHSWRHFFNTLCRVGQVPDSKLQKVTGHKTLAMTEHYTHYRMEDFQDVRRIQEELFASGNSFM